MVGFRELPASLSGKNGSQDYDTEAAKLRDDMNIPPRGLLLQHGRQV